MANPTPTHSRPHLDRTLILGLGVTFLASVGTGAITNGIYFLTESALGYGRVLNYALALLVGLAYIIGAAGIGPVLTRISGRLGSTRRVAITLLTILGGFCFLPILAAGGVRQTPPAWSIWVTGASFGVLTGCLWPIVEAYISGGRRDANLRSAIGAFNIVWATAVIGSMWLIAPYVAQSPLMVFFWVGIVHFISVGLLLPLPNEPPKHLDDSPHHVEPSSRVLLRVTRILLPASYLLIASLAPAIPVVLGGLGVEMTWKGPLFSIWLGARLSAFILLERWHGWHGRRWPPLVGGIGLIAGFAGAMLAPRAGDAGMGLLVGSLIVFGVSAGLIYVAALYYGMEVGGARVDDGGHHESIIGLGYAGGPACGLLGFLFVSPESGMQDLAVVVIAGLAAAAIIGTGFTAAYRSHRFTTKISSGGGSE
jgi:MFS family permease